MRGVSWIGAYAVVLASGVHAQVVQTTQGEPDSFGLGFTALSESKIDYRLQRPASVVLLWVAADGRLDLFFPLRSHDRVLRRAGNHTISVREVPSPIQAPVIAGAPVSGRAGQFAPPRSGLMTGAPPRRGEDSVSGYWVLFLTDAKITAVDVQNRLAPMSQEGGGLAVIDRIAGFLVEENVPWAVYVAAVILR